MAWYSAEVQAYPRWEFGLDADPTMPRQVVCLQTNQPEYVRLVMDLVGDRYCDLHKSPSGQSLILYVAPPPGGSLAEVRRSIHYLLREQLLATSQQPTVKQWMKLG